MLQLNQTENQLLQSVRPPPIPLPGTYRTARRAATARDTPRRRRRSVTMAAPDYYALLGVPRNATTAEVRKAFRLLHWGLMPTRLRYMALPSRWARFGLNYMYMNLKAKCFSDGVGRVCAKPGHSCLRKVVSWRSHPAVDYYR